MNRRFTRVSVLASVLVVAFPLSVLAGFVYSAYATSVALNTGSLVISAHGDVHCGQGRSAIGDAADPGGARGEIRTRVRTAGGACTGAIHNVPAGYLAVATRAYRQVGSTVTFCGETAFAYSAAAFNTFAVGATLCSNPAGVQEFWAQARPRHGYDSAGGVLYATGVWGHLSPIQAY